MGKDMDDNLHDPPTRRELVLTLAALVAVLGGAQLLMML